MMIEENIKKTLRDAPVGDRCMCCNTLCDASAVLGMQIDTSKFPHREQARLTTARVCNRRKRELA